MPKAYCFVHAALSMKLRMFYAPHLISLMTESHAYTTYFCMNNNMHDILVAKWGLSTHKMIILRKGTDLLSGDCKRCTLPLFLKWLPELF